MTRTRSAVSKARPAGVATVAAPRKPVAAPVRGDAFPASLFSGGDSRLTLDPVTGASRYGCRPEPAPDLAPFGSSTASTLSATAETAARALFQRFQMTPQPLRDRMARLEMARLRFELIHLCGVGDLPGLEVVFAPSGTDLHLIAADLLGDRLGPEACFILADPAETGSGVPAALTGRHFADSTPSGRAVAAGERLAGMAPVRAQAIALRTADGAARPLDEIDAEVEAAAHGMIAEGRRVVIVLADGSKTGLVAPSPACAARLKRAAPATVEVLVDACQFRMSTTNLRAYLEHGFLVAVTGSKFLTGPTFSGVLFAPPAIAPRLAARGLCAGLADYGAALEWPADWAGVQTLRPGSNLGLMLRWEAALAELRRFRALPGLEVAAFFGRFGEEVSARLEADPAFDPLPAPELGVRLGADDGWDAVPTIFPFVLQHVRDGDAAAPFTHEQTLKVYAALRRPLSARPGSPLTPAQAALPVELGQPVVLGVQNGKTVSALRICASARLAVEAWGGNEEALTAQALDALAKTAEIAWRVSHGLPL